MLSNREKYEDWWSKVEKGSQNGCIRPEARKAYTMILSARDGIPDDVLNDRNFSIYDMRNLISKVLTPEDFKSVLYLI